MDLRYSDKKPYKYKIHLMEAFPRERPQPEKPQSSLAWKTKTLERMRVLMFFQAKKSLILLKRPGHRVKVTRGYGAPRRLEYLCSMSAMIIVKPGLEEIRLARKYWYECYEKSREIYWWLQSLEPECYNRTLHLYLFRLAVTGFPCKREKARYEKAKACSNGKPDPDRPLYFLKSADSR